ncbi:MAG: ATP-binding cassette domain-containing protein [Treponemataceae bacterium]|nr:ATP-binding cassette domain-containing protein [Treponemataceae bacterium]
MSNACLTVLHLSKSFTLHQLHKHIRGCRDVSFTLQHGEFLGITGKSGSGKSTVLKLIYRSYLPQEGSIMYDSHTFGPLDLCSADERTILYLRKKEIGYVSQFLHVIPRTTAREIVEHAVLELGKDPQEAQEIASYILHHFELDPELHDSYPATFSGGEKLRLNIARAMAKRPRLLLLDEPTASLDSHTKRRVRDIIEQLKAEGTTMVGIFHDLDFMEGLCDRVLTMEEGQIKKV